VKALHLMAMSAAMSALLILAAARADAQGRVQGPRINIPPPPPIGVFNSYPGVWVVEREVPVIIEREVPVPVPATPPPAPPVNEGGEVARKPYAIGNSYDSLPASCMKMIEEEVSYYYCDGGWYREVRNDGGVQYKAVRAP